ncbi:MAG: hypothetical protein ACLRPW_05455 [Intestinibacter sp.]
MQIIDRNSNEINLDKIMFIYKYGSKKAKQIVLMKVKDDVNCVKYKL